MTVGQWLDVWAFDYLGGVKPSADIYRANIRNRITPHLEAVRGGELEHRITAALFTGLRLSELLGLIWDAVDFDKGTITINKQLARPSLKMFSSVTVPFAGGLC